MKASLLRLFLSLLSIIFAYANPRMLFLDLVVELLPDPVFNLIGEVSITGYSKTTTNVQIPEIEKILGLLDANTQLLTQINQRLSQIGDQFENAMEKRALEDKIAKIRESNEELYFLLKSFQKGDYKGDHSSFVKQLDKLADKVQTEVVEAITWMDINKMALPYLERHKKTMDDSRVDLVTYSIELSAKIKEFGSPYQIAMDLFNFFSYKYSYFKRRAESLKVFIEKLQEFEKKYIEGALRPLFLHFLQKGPDSFSIDKVFKHFGESGHWVPLSEPPIRIGMEQGNLPYFTLTVENDTMGNQTFKVSIGQEGERKFMGVSENSPVAQFESIKPGSDIWKISPCPNNNLKSATSLDYACIINVQSGLYLTLEMRPHGETETAESSPHHGLLRVQEFLPDSPYQIWTIAQAKRCCTVWEEADFKGKSQEICLDVADSLQNFLNLPEGFTQIGSVICQAQTRFVGFDGVYYSGAEIEVAEGTQVSAFDPEKIDRIESFRIESVCSRLFADQSMDRYYITICSDIKDLGEQFADKDLSIMLSTSILDQGYALRFYQNPNFEGNYTTIRINVPKIDLPWPPKSVKILKENV